MIEIAQDFKDLRVYKNARSLAIDIFTLTKAFPTEEKYSLVDQIRRSSRSICANLAEAWRKRRYRAAFVSKLSDAEAEACETQVWIDFSVCCGYLDSTKAVILDDQCRHILAQISIMIKNADSWTRPDP